MGRACGFQSEEGSLLLGGWPGLNSSSTRYHSIMQTDIMADCSGDVRQVLSNKGVQVLHKTCILVFALFENSLQHAAHHCDILMVPFLPTGIMTCKLYFQDSIMNITRQLTSSSVTGMESKLFHCWSISMGGGWRCSGSGRAEIPSRRLCNVGKDA